MASIQFLQPKQTRCFVVTFESLKAQLEHKIPINELSSQVVSFDLGTEFCNSPTLTHRTNNVIAWVEDTESCNVMKILRSLQQRELDDIKITVELRSNTDKPLERFTYTGAQLVGVQHSLMSYQTSNHSSLVGTVNIYQPPVPTTPAPVINFTGSMSNPTVSLTMQKLVQFSFTDFNHEILV